MRFIRYSVSLLLSLFAFFANGEILYSGDLRPLYELRSASSTDSFYTTDAAVKDLLLTYGFDDLGIAAIVGSWPGLGTGVRDTDSSARAFRRFYIGAPQRNHFYSTSSSDVNPVLRQQYVDEGYEGALFTRSLHTEMTPIYRLFKAYTGGDIENKYVVSAADLNRDVGIYGFTNDGVVGYVFPKTALKTRTDEPSVGIAGGSSTRDPEFITAPSLCGDGVTGCTGVYAFKRTCGGIAQIFDESGALIAEKTGFALVNTSTTPGRSRFQCAVPTTFPAKRGTTLTIKYYGFVREETAMKISGIETYFIPVMVTTRRAIPPSVISFMH
jgi:hypothetical protein